MKRGMGKQWRSGAFILLLFGVLCDEFGSSEGSSLSDHEPRMVADGHPDAVRLISRCEPPLSEAQTVHESACVARRLRASCIRDCCWWSVPWSGGSCPVSAPLLSASLNKSLLDPSSSIIRWLGVWMNGVIHRRRAATE